MPKRDNGTARSSGTTATNASRVTTTEVMEQRLVGFAEHLGEIAGTLQAKADGWMDREALKKQIASVRDGAADLLEALADRTTTVPIKTPAVAAPGGTKGRSGDVVDAPGKKHRKPMPTDPGANVVDSQAAKMRTARTMVKTHRRRGRG